VTDRIDVLVEANNGVRTSLAKYNNYICAEILAIRSSSRTILTVVLQ
jgi:hypothetical protein